MLIQTEQLKALPLRPEAVWQGGWVRLPLAAPDEPGLFVPVWLDVTCQRASGPTQMPAPEDELHRQCFHTLVSFALDKELTGYRPGRVEVGDTALADYLVTQLAGTGIRVTHCPNGVQPLDGVLEDLNGQLLDCVDGLDDAAFLDIPDMLSVEGVTVDRVRSFAEAAAAFFEAAPWELLTDEDLIHVLSPEAPDGMEWLTVLGAGDQTFGLGFYKSREHYESILYAASPDEALMDADGAWSVQFGPLADLTPQDADLWRTHRLPVSSPDAYPVLSAICMDGGCVRPDAQRLAWVEGLLRVLARVSDQQLDNCRWQSKVPTSCGDLTFRLNIPDLGAGRYWGPAPASTSGPHETEVMLTHLRRIADARGLETAEQIQSLMRQYRGKAVPKQPGRTPLEVAQDLIYEAHDQFGRRRIKLARQALKICPDCADGYVLLAEETGNPERRTTYYMQGVAAGERALGAEAFQKDAGHFWGILETRPYMRARLGLARCLEADGRVDEAIEHYWELLRLNPGDNQGVRESLGLCLLESDRDAEALELAKRYAEDFLARPLYLWTLAEFRVNGNSDSARKALRRAVKANPYVARYLLDEDVLMDDGSDSFTLGSEEEAADCYNDIADVWEDTPEALHWLQKYGRPDGKPPKRYKQRKSRSR